MTRSHGGFGLRGLWTTKQTFVHKEHKDKDKQDVSNVTLTQQTRFSAINLKGPQSYLTGIHSAKKNPNLISHCLTGSAPLMEGTRTRRRPSSISRARQRPGQTPSSWTGRRLDSVLAFMSCKRNKTAGIVPEPSSCLLSLRRSALEGMLSSSYRPQDTLSAERERRRLEREERLQRIEREERNRFRLASLQSFHARDNILDSLSLKAAAAKICGKFSSTS